MPVLQSRCSGLGRCTRLCRSTGGVVLVGFTQSTLTFEVGTPVKPVLHVQTQDPRVFVQSALEWQLWPPWQILHITVLNKAYLGAFVLIPAAFIGLPVDISSFTRAGQTPNCVGTARLLATVGQAVEELLLGITFVEVDTFRLCNTGVTQKSGSAVFKLKASYLVVATYLRYVLCMYENIGI